MSANYLNALLLHLQDFGFNILLDNKPLKTPAGRPLTLPSIHLALAVAAEWEWQVCRVFTVQVGKLSY